MTELLLDLNPDLVNLEPWDLDGFFRAVADALVERAESDAQWLWMMIDRFPGEVATVVQYASRSIGNMFPPPSETWAQWIESVYNGNLDDFFVPEFKDTCKPATTNTKQSTPASQQAYLW